MPSESTTLSTTLRFGFIIDPPEQLNPKKDTSIRLMQVAHTLGHQVWITTSHEVFSVSNRVQASWDCIEMLENTEDTWFHRQHQQTWALNELDVVIMRKDPPFDDHYLQITQLLSQAQHEGALVLNPPQTLRDWNEKLATLSVPHLTPHVLVTCQLAQLKDFLQQQQHIVLKPLTGMGGQGIYQLHHGDPNTNVILETITQQQRQYVMAQRYLPAISEGDKRIILINGEAIPYGLSRIPPTDDFRGNLAKGATAVVTPLTATEQALIDQLQPWIQSLGLWFVGLDVIGDCITEINITSPTGIVEIEQQTGILIAERLIQAAVARIDASR